MSQCLFQWSDGWSKDHICGKVFGHPGDHRCQCDAFISDWMINNAPEALAEDDAEDIEAERQRLRKELQKLQSED